MFDSDGEGRQLEGFDANDTTPEFSNRARRLEFRVAHGHGTM